MPVLRIFSPTARGHYPDRGHGRQTMSGKPGQSVRFGIWTPAALGWYLKGCARGLEDHLKIQAREDPLLGLGNLEPEEKKEAASAKKPASFHLAPVSIGPRPNQASGRSRFQALLTLPKPWAIEEMAEALRLLEETGRALTPTEAGLLKDKTKHIHLLGSAYFPFIGGKPPAQPLTAADADRILQYLVSQEEDLLKIKQLIDRVHDSQTFAASQKLYQATLDRIQALEKRPGYVLEHFTRYTSRQKLVWQLHNVLTGNLPKMALEQRQRIVQQIAKETYWKLVHAGTTHHGKLYFVTSLEDTLFEKILGSSQPQKTLGAMAPNAIPRKTLPKEYSVFYGDADDLKQLLVLSMDKTDDGKLTIQAADPWRKLASTSSKPLTLVFSETGTPSLNGKPVKAAFEVIR